MSTDWNDHYCLGDISVDDFLDHYWQQKPLRIENAFPGIRSPISADELAGLACEEGVNARLVLEKGKDRNWQVEFAPIAEQRFAELPQSHWSLLVSDIERHVPEAGFLLKPFRFIPDWRIDDLMVSYAPPGGSVGPHTDEYDVFLIQLSGRRLWKISEHYDRETLRDTDLCVLNDFVAETEWLMNPGDMLYLPPRVAHHGIADEAGGEPCLTASVGFRAPSVKTMTADYVAYLNEHLHGTQRYRDRNPEAAEHPAQITDQTVACFRDYLQQALDTSPERVIDWLGRFSSNNSVFEDNMPENENLNYRQLLALTKQHGLQKSPWSNFLFYADDRRAQLFVDGESYRVTPAFARALCDDAIIADNVVVTDDPDEQACLQSLYRSGALLSAKRRP